MNDIGPGSYFISTKTATAPTHEELGLDNAFYFSYCSDCGEYIGVTHEPEPNLRCSVCAPPPSWVAKEMTP